MRAYDVETAVFKRRRTRLEMVECRAIAARLCEHFDVPSVHVERTHGSAQRSWYWHPTTRRDAVIRLEWDAADWIVCHEVAHHVAFQARGSKAGHGELWATRYCEAVALVISETYATRLRRGFERAGVIRAVQAQRDALGSPRGSEAAEVVRFMPTSVNIAQVLYALEDHRAYEGDSGTTIKELTRRTGLSETTVRMTVKRLVAGGFAEHPAHAPTRVRAVRKYETVIYEAGGEVIDMAATKAAKKAAAARKRGPRKPAKPVAPPRGNGKAAGSRDADVLAFVRAAGKAGVTLADVRKQFKLPYNLAYLSLTRARANGEVVIQETGTRTPVWVATKK